MQDLEGFFDSFPPNQMNFNFPFSRLGQGFGQQAVEFEWGKGVCPFLVSSPPFIFLYTHGPFSPGILQQAENSGNAHNNIVLTWEISLDRLTKRELPVKLSVREDLF